MHSQHHCNSFQVHHLNKVPWSATQAIVSWSWKLRSCLVIANVKTNSSSTVIFRMESTSLGLWWIETKVSRNLWLRQKTTKFPSKINWSNWLYEKLRAIFFITDCRTADWRLFFITTINRLMIVWLSVIWRGFGLEKFGDNVVKILTWSMVVRNYGPPDSHASLRADPDVQLWRKENW